MRETQQALQGETIPLVTPFDGTDVDHDALASVVEHVRDGGADALFPLGTTGEFASLTDDEQEAVIETVVEESGELPVIAGASATAVEDAVEHAKAATMAGAHAIALTPPYFHTASGPQGNYDFFEAVAEVSPLSIVLYNVPQHVGSSLEVETVAALAERDDVLGIKDSSGDLTYDLALDAETPEDFLVLQGYDTLLLPGLRMGMDGGVNALANVVPEAFATIQERPDSKAAREVSTALSGLFGVALDAGFASAVKAGLVERDVLDSASVRPPLEPVGDQRRTQIGNAIDRILDAA